jgi:hypothetical protein
MPSNTPNLNLYKKNPATDGDDTFNIETMLNENFDKIDAHAGDNTRHITAAERNTWNAKETTGGAQAKADTARDAVITAAAQDATAKANTAKDAAISAAATDATAKANAAREAAKAASIPIEQKGVPGGVVVMDANRYTSIAGLMLDGVVPEIIFTESDTGKKWFQLVDGEAMSFRENDYRRKNANQLHWYLCFWGCDFFR